MLFRLQQQLDCLPSYEALRCEGGTCRCGIGISFGLQGVEAAEGLVNEG